MPRVIHFEITAKDTERAAAFYRQVFGWTIEKWDGPVDSWLVTTGADDEPGINGAIMTEGAGATVNTIDVLSVDDFAQQVTANGGKVISEKTTVSGVGYFHYCEDTEGNPFGIMEADEPASG